MFDSNEFGDDDLYKRYPVSTPRGPSMDLLLWLAAAVVTSILLAIICRCCCRSKSRGRIIAPPPRDESVPAPYPQQQYAAPLYPGESAAQAQPVTLYPVGAGYPTAAPYPAGAPYPTATPYPTGAPYPTTSPYPAGAPYPTGAPYPHAAAPAQFPTPAPYPPAPTAPDVTAFYGVAPPGWSAQACPPSYDQVMSAEQHKQPPYNPHAPH